MVPRADEYPLSQARIKTIKFIVCNDLDTLLPDKKQRLCQIWDYPSGRKNPLFIIFYLILKYLDKRGWMQMGDNLPFSVSI